MNDVLPADESWTDYSHRSCSEVLNKFQHLVSVTDFTKEASSWPFQIDPAKNLVFVAYFVTETELAELRRSIAR
jgi:phage terminase large subunit